ncbi:MAG: 2-oxoglutarate dehydrogenase E1 subunit family protein, partial [Bacteroidota bacterium]
MAFNIPISNSMHQFSFLTASDAVAIEALYHQYNNDPASVDLQWARFFE